MNNMNPSVLKHAILISVWYVKCVFFLTDVFFFHFSRIKNNAVMCFYSFFCFLAFTSFKMVIDFYDTPRI